MVKVITKVKIIEVKKSYEKLEKEINAELEKYNLPVRDINIQVTPETDFEERTYTATLIYL